MFIVFNNHHLEALNLEETVFQNRIEKNNIKEVRCKKKTHLTVATLPYGTWFKFCGNTYNTILTYIFCYYLREKSSRILRRHKNIKIQEF